ncbi:MAG: hypothetical protein LBB45_09190 [Methanobrevibacter sp.]|nr:hypothetical protein [Candidatus Methanovirga basalitermitum]
MSVVLVYDRDINVAISIKTVGTIGFAFLVKLTFLVSGLGNRFRDRIYGFYKS